MANFEMAMVFLFILSLSFLKSGSVSTDDQGQERILLNNEHDFTTAFLALQQEVGSLKKQVEQLTNLQSTGPTSQPVVTSQGSAYIRWGRTVCPSNGTDRVYFGFAAANYYSYHGGAAYFLCLESEPTWGVYDDANHAYAFQVYGVEYDFRYSISKGGEKVFRSEFVST